MSTSPKSSFQVELIVCSEAWAPRLAAALRSSGEQQGLKHWRCWAEITLPGCLSSPAGKDLSTSKNSHWATGERTSLEEQTVLLPSYRATVGGISSFCSPCTSKGREPQLKARGWNCQGDSWHTGSKAQTSPNYRAVFLCDLVWPIPFTPLSQDLNPPLITFLDSHKRKHHLIFNFVNSKALNRPENALFYGILWASQA